MSALYCTVLWPGHCLFINVGQLWPDSKNFTACLQFSAIECESLHYSRKPRFCFNHHRLYLQTFTMPQNNAALLAFLVCQTVYYSDAAAAQGVIGLHLPDGRTTKRTLAREAYRIRSKQNGHYENK